MALTADQITAKNFKEFYDKIFPYLNGGLARNNYSTDEQVVGTWIDGKPLYQKTFVLTTPAKANTDTNIPLGNNLEIIDLSGFVLNGGFRNPINWHYKKDVNNYISCYVSGNDLIFTCESYYTSKPLYVTIQYTKTTD